LIQPEPAFGIASLDVILIFPRDA